MLPRPFPPFLFPLALLPSLRSNDPKLEGARALQKLAESTGARAGECKSEGAVVTGFVLSYQCALLIGAITSDWLKTAGAPLAIIKAAVAGAFLYIGIVEVGMKELLVCRSDLDGSHLGCSAKALEVGKLFMFLLGFLAMSVLAAYI